MKTEYKNNRIKRVCTDIREAERAYGIRTAQKLHQRIKEIKAVHDVETMLKYGIGRCHKLHGDRKNQYAVDLVHPYRLVFEKHGDSIQIAMIMEVVDYH